MVIVLSETEYCDPYSVNGRELDLLTRTAELVGCRIVCLPNDFAEYGGAEVVFDYVPKFLPAVPAVWVGYIPSEQRYREVFEAAASKGIHLLNTPEQYQLAMEFSRFYPLLAKLTPRSAVVSSMAGVPEAALEVRYPLFVKGSIKSN